MDEEVQGLLTSRMASACTLVEGGRSSDQVPQAKVGYSSGALGARVIACCKESCWRSSEVPGRAPTGFAVAEFLAVFGLVLLLIPRIAWAKAGPVGVSPTEQTLAAVQGSMAKSPPPWPEDWRREYVEVVRRVIASHPDAPGWVIRLQIIRNGFEAYWQHLQKGRDRPLFEVRCAEIRWYVESLMTAELATEAERQRLREQHRDLADHGVRSLLKQFPFLDPNLVSKAKEDYLADCDRAVESPLLPVFLHALSEAQIVQMKQHWDTLRYARVDLWRQLGDNSGVPPAKQDAVRGDASPDYLLARRSLAQLRGQLWAVVAVTPDYYRAAAARATDWQKRRSEARLEARNREDGPERTIVQAEYLAFLWAALLETAEILEEGADK